MPFHNRTLWFAVGSFVVGTHAIAVGQSKPDDQTPQQQPQEVKQEEPAAAPELPEVDRGWLDRVDEDERALLDANRGYAPPPMNDDLIWPGGDPTNWEQLRGKVVIVQSWSTSRSGTRSAPARALRSLQKLAPDREAPLPEDIVVLALHTPDGADKVDRFLEQRPLDNARVLVDPKGLFCDQLGFYDRPANLVVDRAGVVRYAGLKPAALADAVKPLLAEPYDEDAAPPATRPDLEPEQPTETAAGYPPIAGQVSTGLDIRGKRAPDFYVQQWVGPEPDLQNKVVMIDFWATWCGPCVASIPHLNELSTTFGDKLAIVGISDENESKFTTGMEGLRSRNRLPSDGFKYAVAIDPSRRMFTPIQIRGIPHAIVMSSDWIVRWQGNPSQLSTDTMRQIIEANAGGGGTNGGAKSNNGGRYRWTNR